MVVATVCVLGHTATKPAENKFRAELMLETVREARERRPGKLDVLLFPGGFFKYREYVGHFDYHGRKKKLESASFSNACAAVGKQTSAHVIAGVDSEDSPRDKHDDVADQLCVAWNGRGIVSIAKKVFPTEDEGYNMGCYVEDYSTVHRLLKLTSGRKSLLCACYDMFGCADSARMRRTRERFIRNLCDHKGNHLYEGVEGFRIERQQAVRSFWECIRNNGVRTAFVAIHGFHTSGRDNRWQNYGLDGAAQAINGCAFGAAHYTHKLPSLGTTLTLAATRRNVYTHATAPRDEFYTCDGSALVRVLVI